MYLNNQHGIFAATFLRRVHLESEGAHLASALGRGDKPCATAYELGDPQS
jgi:hypothetical protein